MSIGDNPFDEDSSSSDSIDSIELLETIRTQARPSWSPEIDRLAAAASSNGWTLETLAAALAKDTGGGAGPGVTMMLLRRLAKMPPPRPRTVTGREAAIIGHSPCNMPQHGDKCQICRCDKRREEHIIITPMPDWFRQEYGPLFRSFGTIPHE